MGRRLRRRISGGSSSGNTGFNIGKILKFVGLGIGGLLIVFGAFKVLSSGGDEKKMSGFVETEQSPAPRDLWNIGDKRVLQSASDELIEKGHVEMPFYLRKGDKLTINFTLEDAMPISLWNYDKGSKLKDFGKTKSIVDAEVEIPVSAIYYLVLNNGNKQYVSFNIEKSSSSFEDYSESTEVRREVVKEGVSANDPRAVKFEVVEPTSLFNEPKQITLKKLFHLSGSNRSVIPVKIPKGATNIICRMRVSSSRNTRIEDGKLHKDVSNDVSRFIDNFSLKRQTARMIFDELNRPHTEHDWTIDMYVFNEQKWARGFQTGNYDVKWQNNYDVSNSVIGTQSCNALLNVSGKSMVYLGFEGTHSFDDTYLWLECEFLKPTVKYTRIDYKR